MGSSVSMEAGEAECTSAYPRQLSVEGSTEVWKALPCEDVTGEMDKRRHGRQGKEHEHVDQGGST